MKATVPKTMSLPGRGAACTDQPLHTLVAQWIQRLV